MRLLVCCLSLLPALGYNCDKDQEPAPGPNQENPVKVAVNPVIREASGIADSRANPGNLWVIEDSGNPPDLILLGHNGVVKKRIALSGISNRDWEDLALGNGNLYIADIGDNNQDKTQYNIHILPEPLENNPDLPTPSTLQFRYADKPHDAEALLVDPKTQDIYILTKRDEASLVFRIAYPYKQNEINIAEKVGTLPFSGVVSAAVNGTGEQVLVKTYGKIYRFAIPAGQQLTGFWQQTPQEARYLREPQGEAVCFQKDKTAYFTLSEQAMSKDQFLYLYQ